MSDVDTWVDTFFSGNPPEFIEEARTLQTCELLPDDDTWKLEKWVDNTRLIDDNKLLVF